MLVFKLDFLKIFLLVKLSEALKNLTGLTTSCMIRDVRNDQVFQIFIDAYENRRAMKLCGVVKNDQVFQIFIDAY